MAFVIVKPKRDKSLLRRHPWVFSGAVARTRGNLAPGDTVDVVTPQGNWLGRGAHSPRSQICVRIWTFDEKEPVDEQFFRRRLERALANRRELVDRLKLTGYRVVNAESDGLPGVIIDRYGDYLVGQFLTVGAEVWKDTIVRQLQELIPIEGIFERSDSPVRDKEGLPRQTGALAGKEPPETIAFREGPHRFWVDVRIGHKTGFYLDQRDNRFQMNGYVSGAEVLNCFSYTGGFGVAALKAGASQVTNVDVSAAALALSQRNIAFNDLNADQVEHVEADVFKQLRYYRDAARSFDVIVLDPPKFADSRAQVSRASRGYKDINLLAIKLLRAGGYLFTFSCSGLMEPELFQKIVADAARDARRDTQIVRRLNQASDHPTALNFPEGHYLKGLLCRIW
ncbi:MAG: class I SAM-dependent methyltransferase [Desulfosarcina sp.]|nr:class I SAM-dependent methyltransferase [Desulfobacterales bacterium]